MENIYLKTKEKITCNGCTACALVCPKGAIEMVEDSEGFIYPKIIEEKCIKCGKCLNTCSNYSKNEDRKYISYAAINNDKQTLAESTSGGAFSALAKKLFKNKDAVCYGAVYNEDFEVTHTRAETLEQTLKFRGSKYLRSNILGIYESVKKDLKEGKQVLFTGTPCQTAGLSTYLNKDYPNLILCDIICHSNPSPKVFKRYIKALELKQGSNVKSYSFRAKSNGWDNLKPIVEYENGTCEEELTFLTAFLRATINRPCCYDCKFIKPYNYADITLGDFWGVDKLTNISNYQNGISLVLVNTKKGQEFFETIQGLTLYKLDDAIDVFKYNHKKPDNPHRNREKFFKRLDNIKDENVLEYINKMSRERLARRIINKLKRK